MDSEPKDENPKEENPEHINLKVGNNIRLEAVATTVLSRAM